MKVFRICTLLFLLGLMVWVSEAQSSTIFTRVVSQRFEHGEMLYRQDTGEVIIFYENGRWLSYTSQQYGRWSVNTMTTAPAGFHAPINGFGRIWAHESTVRQTLGWASLPEIGYETSVTFVSPYSYYLRLDGRYNQANTNGTWTYTSTNPIPSGDRNVQIRSLTASPNPVSRGQQLTISWDIQGAPLAVVSIYDPVGHSHPTGEAPLVAWFPDLTPVGSISWTVPETMGGDLVIRVIASDGGSPYREIASRGITVTLGTTVTRIEIDAAFQQYQHGFMIWREDTGEIREFRDNGVWMSFPEHIYAGFSDFSGTVPAGCVAPVNGFGKVWYSYENAFPTDDMTSPLGCATQAEISYTLVIQTGSTSSYSLPGTLGTITISGAAWHR